MSEAAAIIGTINIIAIAVVIALVIAFLLPKKLHYIINGLILLGIGILHILFELYITEFDVRNTPILLFVITFVVMVTAKELISESIKEPGIALKSMTFIIGLMLITLVVVPELYHFGAISFDLPDYPFIVNAVIYIIAGFVAIIAPFLAE
ncbi:hypothetical protein ACFL96_03180 [Thermoproteota archaeon]